MSLPHKATRIEWLRFNTPTMRGFHATWFAFFVAFFAWFAVAPLMAVVREDLELSQAQVGNCMLASVAITVLARIVIGPLCDRFGPRLTYTWLLVLGSVPVMAIGLAQSYEAFLIARLAIGALGASFVITQYHTMALFAPNVVGTATATTAGWGNLGGGVAQILMPLVLVWLTAIGVDRFSAWRWAMTAPAAAMLLTGIAYYLLTRDAPEGNDRSSSKCGFREAERPAARHLFWLAARDYRVWALFVAYAACFGVELTINNMAALYYHDRFHLDVKSAGLIAGLFGVMNLFARTAGGLFSDWTARRSGPKARVACLGGLLFFEGMALVIFSQMSVLGLAVAVMIVFSVLVQMAEGATFAVVPFINRRYPGAVAGLVGAGGNVGAVAAGLLFRIESFTASHALLWTGAIVAIASGCALIVRLPQPASEAEPHELREISRPSDLAALTG